MFVFLRPGHVVDYLRKSRWQPVTSNAGLHFKSNEQGINENDSGKEDVKGRMLNDKSKPLRCSLGEKYGLSNGGILVKMSLLATCLLLNKCLIEVHGSFEPSK